MSALTEVELFWLEDEIEHWIRFGRHVGERILDRRRRVLHFAPGAVFAFVRWASNDYGTLVSRIDILRAVDPGPALSTVPGVTPGGEVLLHITGWPKVERVLRAVDEIDTLGLDPAAVDPNHWRHIHNRVAAGFEPRCYTLARHRAWRLRHSVAA